MARDNTSFASPFFSRAYGGYTSAQIDFYNRCLGSVRGKTILDPMAGQAFALADLQRRGANLWVGDLSPAPLLLASLRSPEFFENRHELVDELNRVIARLARKRRSKAVTKYVDAWVPPSIAKDLEEFAELVGIGLFDNPFLPSFWRSPLVTRFAVAIAILAAREITCFRSTDNFTWLKPGGLQRVHRICDSLTRAISSWREYSEGIHAHETTPSWSGSISFARMDVTEANFGECPKPHAIVTSPPYANRLDYTKMWGPECEVLSAMCLTPMNAIRRKMIGSTVMRNRPLDDAKASQLPKSAIRALNEIRSDSAAYSDNYYFPFFHAYASSLVAAMRHSARHLRRRGLFVVFVRDTVRKDVLFPTGQIIIDCLRTEGLEVDQQERRVIKSHIGQLRRASTSGLYGLGQQEWWLSFRKV